MLYTSKIGRAAEENIGTEAEPTHYLSLRRCTLHAPLPYLEATVPRGIFCLALGKTPLKWPKRGRGWEETIPIHCDLPRYTARLATARHTHSHQQPHEKRRGHSLRPMADIPPAKTPVTLVRCHGTSTFTSPLGESSNSSCCTKVPLSLVFGLLAINPSTLSVPSWNRTMTFALCDNALLMMSAKYMWNREIKCTSAQQLIKNYRNSSKYWFPEIRRSIILSSRCSRICALWLSILMSVK